MKEIILSRGLVAYVDDEDFEWLNQWEWHADPKGYAVRNLKNENGKTTTLRMHRVIMKLGIGDKDQVDHIDQIKSNNTKKNLRICNGFQNKQNQSKYKNSSSGFKGVNWHKKTSKWQSRIQVDGKRIALGLFSNPEDAYKAYCEAAEKAHKDFANFGDGCILLK